MAARTGNACTSSSCSVGKVLKNRDRLFIARSFCALANRRGKIVVVATMVIHVSDTEAPSAGAPAQEGGRKGMEIVWTPASESNVGDAELPHLGWSKQWARGIRLYFFDEKQLAQSPEGEFDPVIEQWLDMGAKVVREKQSCTHLVLDHMEIGDEERDIIARDDMRWAERNSIGMLSVCKKKNFACQELAWLRAQLTDGGARVCLPFCSLRFVPLAHDVCL